MPVRAQKVLSKPINAAISKEARAMITSDSSMGAAERRERAGGGDVQFALYLIMWIAVRLAIFTLSCMTSVPLSG